MWVRPLEAIGLVMGASFLALAVAVDLPSDVAIGCVVLLTILASYLLATQVLRRVRRAMTAGDLRRRAVLLVTTVAVTVLAFAAAYRALSTADAQQFSEPLSRLDAIYYSMSVLSTVGFGDIAADGDAARLMATLQMTFDLLVITTALTVLMSAAGPMSRDGTGDESAGTDDS